MFASLAGTTVMVAVKVECATGEVISFPIWPPWCRSAGGAHKSRWR